MLGAAEPDPLGAELACLRRVGRGVGVRVHQTPDAVRPAEDRREVVVQPSGYERDGAEHDAARAAVDRDQLAFGERVAAIVATLRSMSIVSAEQPATHGLPIPRATRAAWEAMPPWAVRIPFAAIRPWMSSGLVSQRTRMTSSPAGALLRRVGVEDGPAGRRPGRGGEAPGGDVVGRARVDHRVQEVVDLRGVDA